HGDGLRDGRGKSGGKEHGLRAAASNHPEDDSEDVDQAVLTTEDDVAQPVCPAMVLLMARRADGDRDSGLNRPAQPSLCTLIAFLVDVHRPAPFLTRGA